VCVQTNSKGGIPNDGREVVRPSEQQYVDGEGVRRSVGGQEIRIIPAIGRELEFWLHEDCFRKDELLWRCQQLIIPYSVETANRFKNGRLTLGILRESNNTRMHAHFCERIRSGTWSTRVLSM
jgi:hypothetical protein